MPIATPLQANAAGQKISWDLTEILTPFKEMKFQKGGQVIKYGKAEINVYFMVKGKVLLYQQSQVFGRDMAEGLFVNGEFINPDILGGDVGPGRQAVARAETTVKVIPRLGFLNLMDKHPFLSKLVFSSIVSRQRKAHLQLQRLELMSTRQRILYFLLDYIEKAGRDAGYEKVVTNLLTHQELGQLCNASRQSVTMVLNDLRHRRIVHFNRRYLLVRDMDKLKEMAENAHLENLSCQPC